MNYDLLKLHKKTEEILKKATKKEEDQKKVVEKPKQVVPKQVVPKQVVLNKFARLPYILAVGEPGYFNASEIKLHNLKYVQSKKVIEFLYFPDFLHVLTPDFIASVTVEVPAVPADVSIEVGFIQVITEKDCVIVYGKEGILNWDFPELVTGKCTMVNDSSGVKYPWYGATTEVAALHGPTTGPTFANLKMYDRPTSTIQWHLESIENKPSPTYMYRRQRFYTFVAIKDVNTNICQIIERITWSTEMAIDIDVKEPLTERATFLGPCEQDIPRIVPLYLSPSLDFSGLNCPRANDSQCWIFRSPYKIPEINPPEVTSFPLPINVSHFKKKEVAEEIARVSRIKHY